MTFEQLPQFGAYRCILADPPWEYRSYGGKRGVPHRTMEAPYKSMSFEAIAELPIDRVASAHCALFIWTIGSHLKEAVAVGEAWGFTYSTLAFTWEKMSSGGRQWMGMGHWTRQQVEPVLLFVRGRPGRLAKDVRQHILSPVRAHSQKPEGIYGRIERLVGGPRLELFARQRRAGWDSWGNQLDKFTEAK